MATDINYQRRLMDATTLARQRIRGSEFEDEELEALEEVLYALADPNIDILALRVDTEKFLGHLPDPWQDQVKQVLAGCALTTLHQLCARKRAAFLKHFAGKGAKVPAVLDKLNLSYQEQSLKICALQKEAVDVR